MARASPRLTRRPDTPWHTSLMGSQPEHASLSTRVLDHFGGRTIGVFGSFILSFNQLVGPGLLEIPKVFKMGGWLPVIASLTITCVISTLGVTLLCDVMVRINGEETEMKKIADGIERWADRARSEVEGRRHSAVEVPAAPAASKPYAPPKPLMPSDDDSETDEEEDAEVAFYTPPQSQPADPKLHSRSPHGKGFVLPGSVTQATAVKAVDWPTPSGFSGGGERPASASGRSSGGRSSERSPSIERLRAGGGERPGTLERPSSAMSGERPGSVERTASGQRISPSSQLQGGRPRSTPTIAESPSGGPCRRRSNTYPWPALVGTAPALSQCHDRRCPAA